MGHEVAQRLVWEEKVRCYPAVAGAAYAVRHLPVWPVEGGGDPGSPDALVAELGRLAATASFFAPAAVNTALGILLAAGVGLVDRINAIRDSTKPGHCGQIDQRHQGDYTAATTALDAAIAGYVAASRTDLGITDEFTPAQSG